MSLQILRINVLNLGLDASETEEEVFSDAREGRGSSSGANSPIPTTRVEKVNFITSLV